MLILPAIDLIGGQCVRLVQGDYGRQTTYSDDPVAVARGFYDEGARWLHVVDLDGAKAGEPQNLAVVERIARAVPISIELGGGMTNEAHFQSALDAGVTRVILGSALVKRPEFARWALGRGEQTVCGLDARDRRVAVGGWLETSDADVVEFAQALVTQGARRFIVTDIARDGTLAGPNFDLLNEFLAAVPAPCIQSGGVAELEDIRQLLALPQRPEGVIIGKALYEGRFRVRDVLNIVEEAPQKT